MLSLGYYFNAALGFNALTLQVYGRVRYIVVVNVATIVLNFALSLLLVPRLGALGAGIATMVAVIVHNVLKQVGLRLGTGIGMFEWRYGRVYLVIALGALGLLAIQVIASPPIYVSLGLAALISLFVLWANRELLEVDQMFPELMRIPGLKFLVTGPQK
jgi:O-antigen/teichoic acid export membrane protein